MYYIAAPYTHSNPLVREARAQVITMLTGEIMRRFPTDWAFSPITQGHEVAPTLPEEVAGDHGFWMHQCHLALAQADRLFLLPLPGWEESRGLDAELQYCARKNLPVVYLHLKSWADPRRHDWRNTARFTAQTRSILSQLAGEPDAIQLPAWRKNWRVVELAAVALVKLVTLEAHNG